MVPPSRTATAALWHVRRYEKWHRSRTAKVAKPRSTPQGAYFMTSAEGAVTCAACDVTLYLALASPSASPSFPAGPAASTSPSPRPARSPGHRRQLWTYQCASTNCSGVRSATAPSRSAARWSPGSSLTALPTEGARFQIRCQRAKGGLSPEEFCLREEALQEEKAARRHIVLRVTAKRSGATLLSADHPEHGPWPRGLPPRSGSCWGI
jgi:hypothetical protein